MKGEGFSVGNEHRHESCWLLCSPGVNVVKKQTECVCIQGHASFIKTPTSSFYICTYACVLPSTLLPPSSKTIELSNVSPEPDKSMVLSSEVFYPAISP